jgi:hypothetical protein
MRASMSDDQSFCGIFFGVLSVGVLSVGVVGCSPAAPTAAPAKQVAVHADHDHDHGKHDDHDHGKADGKADDKDDGKDDDKDHGKKDDHDDHVHPETLAAGVLELDTMWGQVKAALKAGDREKADEKVHAVGHLLEDFEALVAKEKADAQEAGKKATQEVFECFDKLDEAFHGDEEDLKKLDLDALGERLEAAIKSLKELATGGSK